jgi:hypothetical protein
MLLFATVALTAVTALGQAPTLRIVQPDGPDLPADLYYGNTKVKPLRLRPGTNQPITIDDGDFFVHQHYIDLLGRFSDQGGLDYWSGQINSCGTNNFLCTYTQRVNVSAAFFIEAEFQRTGSFVYRIYKGSLARRPNYTEFSTDRRQVVDGPGLEASKQAYALAFVQRTEFVQKYPLTQNGNAFVTALVQNIQTDTNVNLPTGPILTAYANGGSNQNLSRALAVREAIDNGAFTQYEYNPSFVLMQYFAYLRRDPDPGGYNFWLDVLNNRVPGNFRGMVCAFITSPEYQLRFGSTATQNDHNCGNLIN